MVETEQFSCLIILWSKRLLSQLNKIKLSCSSIMWLDLKIFELHIDLRHKSLQNRLVFQKKQESLKTELQLVQHV